MSHNGGLPVTLNAAYAPQTPLKSMEAGSSRTKGLTSGCSHFLSRMRAMVRRARRGWLRKFAQCRGALAPIHTLLLGLLLLIAVLPVYFSTVRSGNTESNIICALWPRTDGIAKIRKAETAVAATPAAAAGSSAPPPPPPVYHRLSAGEQVGDDYDVVPLLVDPPLDLPDNSTDLSDVTGDNCANLFQPVMDYEDTDGSSGGPWATYPFLALSAVIQGLDPSTVTYSARLVVRLSMGLWKDLQYDMISLPPDMVLRISVNNGEPQEYSDGDTLGPGAPIMIENAPARAIVGYLSYPYDKYRLRLSLSVMLVNTSNDNSTHFAPFVAYIKTQSSTMFRFNTVDNSLRLKLDTSGSALVADMDAVRMDKAKAFCIIIFAMMWVLTLVCAAHALYVLYVARARPVSLEPAGFAATLLFALPAVREVQPGVPPVGATIDVVGFFFNMTLLGIVCILLVGAALNDALQKQQFEALVGRDGKQGDEELSENSVAVFVTNDHAHQRV